MTISSYKGGVTLTAERSPLATRIADLVANDADAMHGVESALSLLRVSVSVWRGHRKARNVKVEVDGVPTADDTITSPRWNLLPKVDRAQFTLFHNQLETIFDRFIVPPSKAGVGAGVVGNGIYLVPSANMPVVDSLLCEVRDAIARTAEALASADGYAALVARVAEKLGPDRYDKAKALMPSPDELRAKFDLRWAQLPVSLTGGDTPLKRRSAVELATEMATIVVERPRAKVADAVGGLADHLVASTAPYAPIRPKTAAGGVGRRRVRQVEIETCCAALSTFVSGFGQFAEPDLLALIDQATMLLGNVSHEALNGSDSVAANVGQVLRRIEAVCQDEDAAFAALVNGIGVKSKP